MAILFLDYFWIRSVQNGSNLQIRWTDISNSRIQAQRAWFLVQNKTSTAEAKGQIVKKNCYWGRKYAVYQFLAN